MKKFVSILTICAGAVFAGQASAPAPERSLAAGTSHFKTVLNVQGQSITLDSETEIAEKDGAWAVTDKVTTPMGVMTDTTTLDKKSLLPSKRHVEQGPAVIDLKFDPKKVSGTMSMSGQSKDVNVDLTGPIFADGAGSMDVISTLPLKEGYTASFFNVDVQQMQAKPVKLSVKGSESVKVAAGTFDTFKVELTQEGGDHMTIWVAKDKHIPVKYSATISAMGGATIDGERQ